MTTPFPCLQDSIQWAVGTSGSNRVKRGGSFDNNDDNLRASNRNDDNPSDSDNNLGFRCSSSRHRQTDCLYGRSLRASRDQSLPSRAGLWSRRRAVSVGVSPFVAAPLRSSRQASFPIRTPFLPWHNPDIAGIEPDAKCDSGKKWL